MRRILPLTLLLFLIAAAPAAAKPIVGLGDQSPQMFSDPAYRALGLKHSRLVLSWDWYRDQYLRDQADAWMAGARAARVRPLIAFNRNYRKGGERKLPSLRAYRKSFKAFRVRFPEVRDFQAWNEANHSSQPTFRKPRAAARYYNALRAMCRKCNVVAADVLDTSNMVPWVKKFKRHARKPRLWGLHSYKDANDGGSRRTRALLKAVRGRIWMTETGGILRLKPAPGSRGKGRRHTQAQQARAVKRVLALGRVSRRIARIYFYEWRKQRGNRWDSALLNANGTKRPAYRALKRGLKRGARR
jgi:hypothetical protein